MLDRAIVYILNVFKESSEAVKFMSELPKDGQLQFLDLSLSRKPDHVCRLYSHDHRSPCVTTPPGIQRPLKTANPTDASTLPWPNFVPENLMTVSINWWINWLVQVTNSMFCAYQRRSWFGMCTGVYLWSSLKNMGILKKRKRNVSQYLMHTVYHIIKRM